MPPRKVPCVCVCVYQHVHAHTLKVHKQRTWILYLELVSFDLCALPETIMHALFF